MYAVTGSIVTYKNNLPILQRTIGSFLNCAMDVKLYVIDNSPSREIEDLCRDKRVEYVFNNKNLGFGAGHNIAIRKSRKESPYHLVLNPDIFFEAVVLKKIYHFMESNKEIGLLMPKICYSDGSVQHLCKLLPTPFDLMLRRSNSKTLYKIFKNQLDEYELRFTAYDKIMDVPHLSGCFMFIRQDVFDRVGFFDTRFFMYLDDVDFSRRIHKHFKTVYHPKFIVYHQHAKDSYNDLTAFMHHSISAIRYFNKWGWFFDKERDEINMKTLERCLTAREFGCREKSSMP